MASYALHWVNCNNCPAENKMTLSLTECGHLLCESCVENLKFNNNKCLVCKRPTSYQALTDVSEDVKEYFKPMDVCDSISKLISNLQKINDFHKKQEAIFAKNAGRKEFMLKKTIQQTRATLQSLMKDLELKDRIIKEYQDQIIVPNCNREFAPEKVNNNIVSQTSKMSTPNSNAFMKGILKCRTPQSTPNQMMTSTPIDRHNATPSSNKKRPTTPRAVTPSNFITPVSMEESDGSRRQNLLNAQRSAPANKVQQTMQFSKPRSEVGNGAMSSVRSSKNVGRSQQMRTNSSSGIPIRQNLVPGSTGSSLASLVEPPPKINRPTADPRPSPALTSYRNLIQSRSAGLSLGRTSTNKNVMMPGPAYNALPPSSLSQINIGKRTNLNMFSHLRYKHH